MKWCDHVRLFLHVYKIADPLIWLNDQRIQAHKCSRYSEPNIQAIPLFYRQLCELSILQTVEK